MNHAGLKNVTEPTRLENKRERRRGAAGRASALRRAPSDSDCSGETASLSADSGDRAPRPLPQPPRSGKTKSRRRGSEWEVLEGLKDGQRFDKRPEVFNGYLHKKRKWPLKGWHKRFFVVDGGILVYARSPTDVARGRLHGSVDVGLSVISAKARRRRIDIDADEFIYHLRAKTPDVFRTWLNVLKVHRLYRQHLLTFGARESVPKIHAPLDDLPATDNSSRTNTSSRLSSSSDEYHSDDDDNNPNESNIEGYMGDIRNNNVRLNAAGDNRVSLCSMNCVARRFDKRDLEIRRCPICIPQKSLNISLGSTAAESQINSTDLDANSLKNTNDNTLHDASESTQTLAGKLLSEPPLSSRQLFMNNKLHETQAYYFFTRSKGSRCVSPLSTMRKSRKSTNLVKYKNIHKEPPLKKPLSKKCMLLGHKIINYYPAENHEVACSTQLDEDINPNHVQITVCTQETKNKPFEDTMTVSDYDKITHKLMISLIKSKNTDYKTEDYIKLIVRELYDSKLDRQHPVKHLFRNLLDYWLKNTSTDPIRKNRTRAQSISRQSNDYFTKDQYLSNIIATVHKETQFHSTSNHTIIAESNDHFRNMLKSDPRKSVCDYQPLKHNDTGHDKERQIQELERLLKNTVYLVETVGKTQSKEKDIRITKTLINNIGKLSGELKDTSNSSLEKIQDTLNHLISETSISTDVAKGFLSVYLDVLLNGDSSITSSDSLTSSSVEPNCDVQTESVIKRVSKSVTNLNADNNKLIDNTDTGQMYLKDMLNKVTSIFSRLGDTHVNYSQSKLKVQDVGMKIVKDAELCSLTCKDIKNRDKTDFCKIVKANNTIVDLPGIGVKKNHKEPHSDVPANGDLKNEKQTALINNNDQKNMIYKNLDEKSIIIDLSKYELEQISMCSDPEIKGLTSISIKLKDKPLGDYNQKYLKLKFTESTCFNIDRKNKSNSKELKRKSCIELNKEFDMKSYKSSSDKTKGLRVLHESDHSFAFSFNSSNAFHKEYYDSNDQQPCYIMSFIKDSLAAKLQPKKKVTDKGNNGINLDPKSTTRQNSPVSVFDKPAPRVIDEKFILLLLENLTLLSKNVPSLHKDINSLYAKLKKKHVKVMKSFGTSQGLSFLGKIYNEDSFTSNFKGIGTQWENNSSTKCDVNTKEISTNTISVICYDGIKKHVLDKRLSAVNLKPIMNSESQTVGYIDTKTENESILRNFRLGPTDIFPTNPTKSELERSNKFKLLSHCQRPKPHTTTDNCNFQTDNKNVKEIKKKKPLPKPRHDKVKETVVQPLYKVSNQAQTEKVCLIIKTDKAKEKEYKVFHLHTNKMLTETKSSSKSDSEIDIKQSNEMKTLYRCGSGPSFVSELISPTAPPIRGPQAGFVSGTPGGRLAGWIIESGGPLENASRELGQAQLSVQQLQRLLDALELQQQLHHDTDVSLEGASPNVKKDRRKFGLRKKKSNSKCSSVELQPPHIDPSGSHMALSALTAPPSPGGGASSMPNSAASLPIACAAARPQSLPGAENLVTATGPTSLTSLTPDHQLREDFTVLAKDLVTSLKTIVSTLVCERGRFRAAMDAADTGSSPNGAVMAALRTNLNTALHQNSELRTRLSRIHDASDLAEISSMGPNSDPVNNRPFRQSLSYSSSCVSASEFFDAEEHEEDLKASEIIAADEAGVIELDGDSSSEAGSLSSEEGSASSDNSDGAISAEQVTLRAVDPGPGWTRRTRLASPRPTPGGPSLWNLLYKNIGKDLSQISMPVTINEPLNMLQRLCEELEYSELLDLASECVGSVERMSLIAAFAVSAYSATAHRAASKPFNPLLAETYECVRDDRGFKFISEQVSHHPPISACHAESSRWCFWQEARIKTKFWGKSMEFQPTGRVHVKLLATGDHYSWNKVTTCVHNLFGGQRWVDQYGDMHITCHGTDITCKLNFIKASSWSSSRHEVRGVISGGGSRLRLSGRWSEALYAGDPPSARCLWRPGAMPPDHELYYGFTRFAMELNELEPGMREYLPHTDTRLRPDQRALEEGDVETAEQLKHQLEQSQRDRRRDEMRHVPAWFRKMLENSEETWVFSGEYWKAREAGFCDNLAPAIW